MPWLRGPAIRSRCHSSATLAAVSGGTFTRIEVPESYTHYPMKRSHDPLATQGSVLRNTTWVNTFAVSSNSSPNGAPLNALFFDPFVG